MYKRHILGKKGEEIVYKYFKENNYQIRQRNFRCNKGEIDLIAYDLKTKEIVFVEVKTRSNNKYGRPIEALDKNKMIHFINTIKYYIYIKKIEKAYIRIDAVEVYVKNNNYIINHIKHII